MRIKTTIEAIREAQAQILQESPAYYLMGEGINDPKGAFGSTLNLCHEFPGRVWDMPVSENGMTGVGIGSAVAGMRPIMIHMRADFLLYAMDQIVNNAAKWWAMFGGQGGSVPLVIRAIVGRGWGQGLQHSQHLESLFADIPGLKVACPSNAYDAKGMLIKAARDNNPVIIFEHRWIHELKCDVPSEMYEVDWNKSQVVRQGFHYTVAAWGYMVHECVKAADFLKKQHIDLTVIDTKRPVSDKWGDYTLVIKEKSCCPPAPNLSKDFYPTVVSIMKEVGEKMDTTVDLTEAQRYLDSRQHDIPNPDFRGPF